MSGGEMFMELDGFSMYLANKYRPWTPREQVAAFLIAVAFAAPRQPWYRRFFKKWRLH